MTCLVEMKVSDLTGAALDGATAVALGGEFKPYHFGVNDDAPSFDAWVFPDGSACTSFSPSTEWSQCGPLIDTGCDAVRRVFDEWHATSCHNEHGYSVTQVGETALVAVCRAIVAAKLGDVVQVPEVLVGRAA